MTRYQHAIGVVVPVNQVLVHVQMGMPQSMFATIMMDVITVVMCAQPIPVHVIQVMIRSLVKLMMVVISVVPLVEQQHAIVKMEWIRLKLVLHIQAVIFVEIHAVLISVIVLME